jgi:hypothetical protein
MFYWKNNLTKIRSFVHLFGIASVLMCSISACNQRGVKHAGYYPIDSLVSSQIHFLTKAKASAQKVARLGETEERQTIQPKDSTGWMNELDIFHELKTLNKPINIGAYKVEDGLTDSRSNLKIKTIVTDRELPVRSMKIYYYGKPENVKRIDAQFKEVNSLYSSTRFLTMEFQDVYNKPVLSSYSINGGQKMFLGDTVVFSVKGNITLH